MATETSNSENSQKPLLLKALPKSDPPFSFGKSHMWRVDTFVHRESEIKWGNSWTRPFEKSVNATIKYVMGFSCLQLVRTHHLSFGVRFRQLVASSAQLTQSWKSHCQLALFQFASIASCCKRFPWQSPFFHSFTPCSPLSLVLVLGEIL